MIKASDMCIHSDVVCFLKTLKFRVDIDVFVIETSIVFIAETSPDGWSTVLI